MTLRVALIGAGEIARRGHLPGFVQAGANIVALCSRSSPRLNALADEYQVERRYTDWRLMLADGDFDAVSICTPPSLHAEMAIECAHHGCHILVEKPMALTADECQSMIDAADQAGVLLMVAHNQRFVSHHRHVKAVLAAGRLGKPYLAHAVFGHGGPEHWSPQQDWYFDAAQAGAGALADLGSHKLDLLGWLLNQNLVEVSAMGDSFAKPGDVTDTAACLLRYDGGTLATVHASWVFTPGWENSLVIRCERGVIRVPTEMSDPAQVLENTDDGIQTTEFAGDGGDPSGWLGMVAAFVQAVEQNQPSPISGIEGKVVIAGVQAAYQAITEHRIVQLPRL